ncbi:hypothetical protein DIPPA_15059 [Diplonema papillatum]|nr:hypothetical protein DIPPA_15059 [Diplonema papillatum]|eukprot:gene9375-14538_t
MDPWTLELHRTKRCRGGTEDLVEEMWEQWEASGSFLIGRARNLVRRTMRPRARGTVWLVTGRPHVGKASVLREAEKQLQDRAARQRKEAESPAAGGIQAGLRREDVLFLTAPSVAVRPNGGPNNDKRGLGGGAELKAAQRVSCGSPPSAPLLAPVSPRKSCKTDESPPPRHQNRSSASPLAVGADASAPGTPAACGSLPSSAAALALRAYAAAFTAGDREHLVPLEVTTFLLEKPGRVCVLKCPAEGFAPLAAAMPQVLVGVIEVTCSDRVLRKRLGGAGIGVERADTGGRLLAGMKPGDKPRGGRAKRMCGTVPAEVCEVVCNDKALPHSGAQLLDLLDSCAGGEADPPPPATPSPRRKPKFSSNAS